MKKNRFLPFAWIVFTLTLVCAGAGLWLLYLSRSVDVGPRWGPRAFPIGFALSFGIMGLLISYGRPENRIGWLFNWIGLWSGIQLLVENYAALAVLGRPGSLPFGQVAGWMVSWVWVVAALPALTFLPLMFPDGRLPTARWRPLAWLLVFANLLLVVTSAFKPGPLQNFSRMENPYPLWKGLLMSGVWFQYMVTQAAILPGIFAAAVSVFVRLRRAKGVERQQLKWFAYAGAAVAVGSVFGFTAMLLNPTLYVVGPYVLILSLLLMPITTGVAVLRYRLWEIDLIIRRTLQYALVTGLLALLYFGGVVILQEVLSPLTGGPDSPLVTVITTLGIAALFNPIRIRVQDFVDRRFYRRKYDAEQTLQRFSATARDEVDLEALTRSLLGVVQETMQPTQTSLWLETEAKP